MTARKWEQRPLGWPPVLCLKRLPQSLQGGFPIPSITLKSHSHTRSPSSAGDLTSNITMQMIKLSKVNCYHLEMLQMFFNLPIIFFSWLSTINPFHFVFPKNYSCFLDPLSLHVHFPPLPFLLPKKLSLELVNFLNYHLISFLLTISMSKSSLPLLPILLHLQPSPIVWFPPFHRNHFLQSPQGQHNYPMSPPLLQFLSTDCLGNGRHLCHLILLGIPSFP